MNSVQNILIVNAFFDHSHIILLYEMSFSNRLHTDVLAFQPIKNTVVIVLVNFAVVKSSKRARSTRPKTFVHKPR